MVLAQHGTPKLAGRCRIPSEVELLFRGRKAAEPDPVKNLEKTAPVTGLVQ